VRETLPRREQHEEPVEERQHASLFLRRLPPPGANRLRGWIRRFSVEHVHERIPGQ
jgi:hypothetical protein